MKTSGQYNLTSFLAREIAIQPLVVFRICFGILMLFSTLRFWAKGWIYDFYIVPDFHFTYWGFDWVKSLGDPGMYILFTGITLACVGIILGAFYRLSAITFFLGFTYVELIDKSTYLNHYYLVSVIAFFMIFLPAHRYFSFDTAKRKLKAFTKVPAWVIYIIIAQISLVYFYAGVAKINYEWLIEAEPLITWLKPKYDTYLLGPFLRYDETAYFFSWFSMLYDCTIPFFMLYKKTRPYAYAAVILFHLFTAWLFPIGVFPYVMMVLTLIYFSPEFHRKIIDRLKSAVAYNSNVKDRSFSVKDYIKKALLVVFIMQVILPWRYLLYPGNMFWTEEGFRFSWRVMLVEKIGTAFFYVKHPDYPGMIKVDNSKFLNPHQEKQMAFQPDMIIQYAHHLRSYYKDKTIIQGRDTICLNDPIICADVFVKMNGRSSRKFIDRSVVLSDKPYNLKHRDWLEPFE